MRAFTFHCFTPGDLTLFEGFLWCFVLLVLFVFWGFVVCGGVVFFVFCLGFDRRSCHGVHGMGEKKKGLNFKNPSHLGLGSENPSHLGEVLIRHVLPFSWVGFFLLSERHFFGIA